MKNGERHYLTCIDQDCELAQCVDRRVFNYETSRLERELVRLQNLLDKARLMVDQANKRTENARPTKEAADE